MKQTLRRWWPDGLLVAGAALIVLGVALVDRPSALIVGGAALIIFGVLAVRGNDGRPS